MRFGKEETSTEDKKPCLQGFVPSWSFLTRLRRPYLFRLAGKDRGEKGRLVTVWCVLPLNSGKHQSFGRRSTRYSPYGYRTTRRLIRHTRFAASCLRTIAVNRRRGGDPDNLYLLAGSVHPRLPLSRGAGAERLRGYPAAAGQRLPSQGSCHRR